MATKRIVEQLKDAQRIRELEKTLGDILSHFDYPNTDNDQIFEQLMDDEGIGMRLWPMHRLPTMAKFRNWKQTLNPKA